MAIQALRHALPAVFGLPAGCGDLFIGVTAPLAAASWSSGKKSGKAVFVLWNGLGLLDLIIALSTGVLAAFTSSGPVTMAPMRLFPLSLVPAFGVPLAFILHFTGLAQFWHQSRKEVASPGALSDVSTKRVCMTEECVSLKESLRKGARGMHVFVHHHRREPGKAAAETQGFVWNWGWVYDLVMWFFVRLVLGDSEQEFRQMIADLAQLQPGETVLDVGCGTGVRH